MVPSGTSRPSVAPAWDFVPPFPLWGPLLTTTPSYWYPVVPRGLWSLWLGARRTAASYACAPFGAGALAQHRSALIRHQPLPPPFLGDLEHPLTALWVALVAVFQRLRLAPVLSRVKGREFLPLEVCGTMGEVLHEVGFSPSSPAVRSLTFLIRKKKTKKKKGKGKKRRRREREIL